MTAVLNEYRYQIISPVTPQVTSGTVRAAYFAQDGEFVCFKDVSHAVVLALRADFVVLIERVVP